MPDRRPAWRVFLLTAVVALAGDQLSKRAVYERILAARDAITVVPGFFYLRRAQNTGVVWGLFGRWPAMVALVGLVAAAVVIFFFHRYAGHRKGEAVAWGAILGGAVGNLIDRVIFGHVRDFLDFSIGNWSWPTFNVADSCITVGAICLIVFYFLHREPPEEA